MFRPTRQNQVFEGLLDVARKVQQRLTAAGIASELQPLPFVSPPTVEGQYHGVTRFARLFVPASSLVPAQAAVALLQASIAAWSGQPNTAGVDQEVVTDEHDDGDGPGRAIEGFVPVAPDAK